MNRKHSLESTAVGNLWRLAARTNKFSREQVAEESPYWSPRCTRNNTYIKLEALVCAHQAKLRWRDSLDQFFTSFLSFSPLCDKPDNSVVISEKSCQSHSLWNQWQRPFQMSRYRNKFKMCNIFGSTPHRPSNNHSNFCWFCRLPSCLLYCF